MSAHLLLGIDVGSTTVKAVAVDASTDAIVWSDYQRHDTKQPEKVMEFLTRMEDEVGIVPGHTRMFITGSGGGVHRHRLHRGRTDVDADEQVRAHAARRRDIRLLTCRTKFAAVPVTPFVCGTL